MHILFDLDGTLTDPYHGITKSIQHALSCLGRPVPSSESIRWCIGPPLRESFVTLLGPSSDHLADVAIEKYRDRFSSIGIFENELYPGIKDALTKLKNRGHRLSVATSKPTVFAKKIIDHFELTKFFCAVDGSELNGTRSNKGELIDYILERDNLSRACTIMIGDREHDMMGARKNEVVGIGVLWGYGTIKELESSGARACIESPQYLEKAIWEAEQNTGVEQ